MNRVGGDVGVLPIEGDLDDNEIVDMLKILTNGFLRMLRVRIVDDQVSSSSNGNLVGDMARKDELTIIPTDLNLNYVSTGDCG